MSIDSSILVNTVQNLKIGVLLQGPNSEILYTNQRSLELLGLSEDQIMGKSSFDPYWNVIHEDGTPFPGSSLPVPQAIANRVPVKNVVMGVFRPAGNDWVWLMVDAEPQIGPDGAVSQVVCTFTDITKLKNVETALLESNKILATFIAQAPIYTYIKEVSRERSLVLYASENFRDMIGVKGSDMIGKTNDDLFPPPIAAKFNADDWAIVSNGTWDRIEESLDGKDYVTYKSPIRLGDKPLLAGYTIDISDQKRAEAALTALNDELETKVLDRTRELQESMIRAEQLNEAVLIREKLASLTPMVAAVSHELNTPIGNIRMLSSAIQERGKTFFHAPPGNMPEAELQAFLQFLEISNKMIMQSTESASALVQSFKKVSVDREGAQKHHFRLRELAEDCIRLITPQPSARNHQFSVDIPPELAMDSFPGALGQVIDNLVRNALIHAFGAECQGRVEIAAGLLGADDSMVQIIVRDNGQGIPSLHRPKVFDPFFTTRLGDGGSGLGLSIVYNIVHKILGGHISLESVCAEETTDPSLTGTRFVVVLPRTIP